MSDSGCLSISIVPIIVAASLIVVFIDRQIAKTINRKYARQT
ncbi:hypothetical protein [Erwinia psidii]|nr:hypothetical protein [Erwinia psidii]